jgi:hypothetical protein
MKRQRGRGRKPSGGGGGGQHHQSNRALESNGPDVKVRGAAVTIYEKYQQLARDASSAGDRVKTENYLQHAEHYFRIMRAQEESRRDRDDQRQPQQGGYNQNGQQGGQNQNGQSYNQRRDGGEDEGDEPRVQQRQNDSGGRNDQQRSNQGGGRNEQQRSNEGRNDQQRSNEGGRNDQREQREPRGDGGQREQRQPRAERTDRAERTEPAEHVERTERPERAARPERAERPEPASSAEGLDVVTPEETELTEAVAEKKPRRGRKPRAKAEDGAETATEDAA